MRRLTIHLIAPLLLAVTAGGQQLIPAEEEESARLPAVSLLPKGSTLEGVMLPQYDEEQRLLAVLRADFIEIIDEETVDADKVQIDMYRPEGGHRGSVRLAKARLDQARKMLHASVDARVVSEDMSARGTGLVLSIETSRGFLLGPVVTRFYTPAPETSMTPPPSQAKPKASRWTAAVAAATSLPLAAAGPAPLTDQEIAEIDRKSASAAPAAEQQATAVAEITATTEKDSREADRALVDLLRSAGLASLLAETAPKDPPPEQPPNIPAKPGDTSIDCDGGMYFDTKGGVIVFLDNIRLRDSRFDLDCTKELKIFLEEKKEDEKDKDGAGKPTPREDTPKEDAPKKDDKEATGDLFGGGNVGAIRQIVATGAVKASRKGEKGKQVTATAETAIFDPKTGDVILRGGYPAIRQGGSSLVAQEPGLYIRLYQNGDFFASPGRWKTIANNLGGGKPGNLKPGR
jgi:hypothetical protein